MADQAAKRAQEAENKLKLQAKLQEQRDATVAGSAETSGLSNTKLRSMIWQGKREAFQQDRQAKRRLADDAPIPRKKGEGKGKRNK